MDTLKRKAEVSLEAYFPKQKASLQGGATSENARDEDHQAAENTQLDEANSSSTAIKQESPLQYKVRTFYQTIVPERQVHVICLFILSKFFKKMHITRTTYRCLTSSPESFCAKSSRTIKSMTPLPPTILILS